MYVAHRSSLFPLLFQEPQAKWESWCPSKNHQPRAGVGVEAHIVSFAPCLVKNGYSGVSLENNLISIIPELIKIDPTGVNVRPLARIHCDASS